MTEPLRLGPNFWENVDRSGGDSACWEWTGPRMKSGGYGRFRYAPGESGRLRAHRLVLCESTGRPYSNPDVARHTCDNPPCCNPGHLLWGSQGDNVQDAVRRGRATNGGNTWTRRLSNEDILGIGDAVSRGFSKLETARMYDCSKVYVESIVSGRSKRANELFAID